MFRFKRLSPKNIFPISSRQISYLDKSIFHETYNFPVETAKSLNPSTYYDDTYWKLEQSNIFGREWFGIGHISEFEPYTLKTFNIGNQSYIITSDKNNNLNAFHNVCSHRGCQLIPTKTTAIRTNKRRITCPYHYWCYKLDGTLLSQPNINKSTDSLYSLRSKHEYALKPINLDIFQGIVFLNTMPYLSHNLPNLQKSFGDLSDRLRQYDLSNTKLQREHTWNINANWKIINENFLEWYHIPMVHSTALDLNSKMEHHMMFQGYGRYCCYMTDPVTDLNSAIDICYDKLEDEKLFNISNTNIINHSRMLMIHLYPNIMMVILPTHWYIQFNFPQKMNETFQKFQLLQHPTCRLKSDNDEQFNNKIDNIVAYWKVVNDEDVEICERVQAGIVSKGFENGGWYSSNFEKATHKFHKMVIDSLCEQNSYMFLYEDDPTNQQLLI
eukprot:512550_1